MSEFLDNPVAALVQGTPWIDLRAPAEKGCMPNSVRLPILSDAERHQVGLCYKSQGAEAAVRLGHALVSGDTKKQRVDAWVAHLRTHPHAVLYCWRGGLRSQIAQEWLSEAGVQRPRVQGGYKALRQSCLDLLDSASETPMLILSGRTGSGKTDLLQEVEWGIDLEGAARHRGSAFGQMDEPQPEPVEFEARLAIQLAQKAGAPYWVLEDEGRMIGRLSLPPSVRTPMLHAPVVVMEVPMQERVAQIYSDYVLEPRREGATRGQLLEQLQGCLARVSKRLGRERFLRIDAELQEAFAEEEGAEAHSRWICSLLEEYYDPMYDYSIQNKAQRTVFRGSRAEVAEFIRGYRPVTSSSS